MRVTPTIRTPSWRIQHFIHNVVIHPLLPLAELTDHTRFHKVAHIIYEAHDITVPEGDDHKLRSI